MGIRFRTKQLLVTAITAATCLLLSGLAFVFYFMHAVYEAEESLLPEEVPLAVADAFHERFPDATFLQWKFADDAYEASFTWEGQEEVEAYFEIDGRCFKVEFPASMDDLPEKARTYLASQRFKVAAIERVEMPGSPIAFEAEVGNLLMEWDCLFDAEGNLLSKTRDGSVLE